MQLVHAVLALVALSPLSGATTWIVDVNNGPGTNFTQISTAIAAVSADDTLVVRPGLYEPFVVNKPLSIIGLASGQVQFTGAEVYNLLPGTTTVIANLYEAPAPNNGLFVLNDLGALMLDRISCTTMVQVTNSHDVRFHNLDAQQGVRCDGSRVEITDSTIVGFDGQSATCGPISPGGAGLRVSGGEVHVACTSLMGGLGGSEDCHPSEVCDIDGANGGAGIELVSGARLVVSGTPQYFVHGGAGGTTTCKYALPGFPGPALLVNAGCEARTSGESFLNGISNQGGTLTHPSPDDPTLLGGVPTAGSNFEMAVQGPVGATVDVILGRRPIIFGTHALDEEQLTPENRVFHLGVIPASGIATLYFPISSSWPQGFSVVFQGRLIVSGSTVFTNSLPAIVQ